MEILNVEVTNNDVDLKAKVMCEKYDDGGKCGSNKSRQNAANSER